LRGRGDRLPVASVDVDVGRSGGGFAGRISLLAAGAGLLLLWLSGGADSSLIEHVWGGSGTENQPKGYCACGCALDAQTVLQWEMRTVAARRIWV
jgi:hypothetical protein